MVPSYEFWPDNAGQHNSLTVICRCKQLSFSEFVLGVHDLCMSLFLAAFLKGAAAV